jgi:hypothetical protein
MIGTREKRNFVLLYNTYNSFLSLCISVIGTAAVKWSPPFRKKEKNKIIRERENSLLQSTTFSKASLYTQIPSIVGRSQTIQGPIKGHVSIYCIGRQTDSCLSRSRRSDKTRQRRILVNLLSSLNAGQPNLLQAKNEFLSILFSIL